MTRRPILAGIVLIASLASAILLSEVLLRAIGFQEPVLYRPDPDLGFSLRPNAKAWWRREGEAWIEINSQGLRDGEHAVSKAPGVLRIAVLGDSYAEALQLPAEQTFWHVLERKLQSCEVFSGLTVEVINFGVSGYGTAQELLMYRHRVRQYSPDIVLLAFTTGNDVRNNSRALEADPLRPYFVVQNGQLREDNSFAESAWFKVATIVSPLIAHSRVLQLADSARIRLKQAARDAEMRRHAIQATPAEVGLDAEIYSEPQQYAWIEAWRVTEQLLGLFAAETRESGARLIVATLSNGIQVNPHQSARKAVSDALGVNDLFYPDRRIAMAGERLGFLVLTLAPQLLRIAESEKVYLHGFPNSPPGTGHWNHAGHLHAGQLLSRSLCRRSMIPTQPMG